MIAYKHKIKPIPARHDVPFVAAPPALGQPRTLGWADVMNDVRAIGFVSLGHDWNNVTVHATNQAWPNAGGRAIIVTIALSTICVEVWTRLQLVDELHKHVALDLAARMSKQVWAHPLRTNPGAWPTAGHTPLIEFK